MSYNLNLSPGDVIFLGDVYIENEGLIDLPGHIIFNNEYVLSNKNDKPVENKVNLVANKNMLREVFPNAEKLYASMTNNHTFDFGINAFSRTVSEFEKDGIFCFGDHFDQSVPVHTYNKTKFTVLGYNMTRPSKTMKPEEIFQLMEHDIPNARKNGADRVLISIHFGDEHEPRNNKGQQMVARKAIDLGADIVIGHHPHCIQNIEIYKDKHIFYSLGNTWFPRHSTPAYFDKSGKMHRVFRARETSWNTKSLVVVYNLNSNDVRIFNARSNNKKFRITGRVSVSEINKYCFKWPKYTGHIRRYYLFAKSNLFIDGQIVDFKSFKHKFFEKKEYYERISNNKQ